MTGSNRGLQGLTEGYKGLQGVTRGYKGLQRNTRGYRRLHLVTGGYKWLQRVTKRLQYGIGNVESAIPTFFAVSVKDNIIYCRKVNCHYTET